MINEVIQGITDAIYEEFGENYETYTESSMQDMKEPAFFVRCLTPDIEKHLGVRRRADLLFAIQYFPESKLDPKREINDAYERMVECLELIAVDGKKVRGSLSCRDISDNILTATAEYTLFVYKKQEDPYMEKYEMKGAVSDGSNN